MLPSGGGLDRPLHADLRHRRRRLLPLQGRHDLPHAARPPQEAAAAPAAKAEGDSQRYANNVEWPSSQPSLLLGVLVGWFHSPQASVCMSKPLHFNFF